MLKLYGKTVDSKDPVWPDGSTMRFLPIKGAAIKSERTKEVVKKRFAYHIWMKANETSLMTSMVNIHQTIDAFEGKTFSEIVLATTSNRNKDVRIFTHFNRAWNMDPTKETWALSVQTQYEDEATNVLRNLREQLFELYGQEIQTFFTKEHVSTDWVDAVTNNKSSIDDDDNWFDDDDDMDELVKKGLIDPAFIQFLKGHDSEMDRQSVASWGTGDTTYTEMVENQDNTSTVSSAITQESSLEAQKEIIRKKDSVIEILKSKGVPEQTLTDIMDNASPYELAFSGVHLSTWKPEKEIFYITALMKSHNTPPHPQNDD
jgi:hypothetical protein